ncbi:MAG: hypothetical protein AAGC71_08095 [Pseudomonadota bacterium]
MTKTFVCIACWLAMSIAAASADPYQSVRDDLASGRFDSAKLAIDRLLNDNPFDRDARLLEAAWLHSTGATAAAMTRLELLANAFPAEPEAYNNLAVLAIASGDSDAAEAWLAKALATSPAYQTVVDNMRALQRARAQEAYAALAGRTIEASVTMRALEHFAELAACTNSTRDEP